MKLSSANIWPGMKMVLASSSWKPISPGMNTGSSPSGLLTIWPATNLEFSLPSSTRVPHTNLPSIVILRKNHEDEHSSFSNFGNCKKA